jgi:ribosomal protein S12 methylthiotransferase accessory factor
MEAIERVCAEQIPQGTEVRRASCRELRSGEPMAVLDPEECELPFATLYREDRVLSWVQAFDFMQGVPIWIPTDLVVSPAIEGVRVGPYTNGLASGNTITEAAFHALCEVIERDAIAHHEFCDAFAEASDLNLPAPRPIDPTTLPTDALTWHASITDAGMRLIVSELRNESQVPTYAAVIIDSHYPTLEGFTEVVFGGWGCDIDGHRALLRAITEAVQCRAITIQGARDSSEGGQWIERAWSLRRAMELRWPSRLDPFDVVESKSSGDLLLDMKGVCSRMQRAGFSRCIVADLTRPDLQVPVVRVVVPGMASPLRYGFRPSWRQLEPLL